MFFEGEMRGAHFTQYYHVISTHARQYGWHVVKETNDCYKAHKQKPANVNADVERKLFKDYYVEFTLAHFDVDDGENGSNSSTILMVVLCRENLGVPPRSIRLVPGTLILRDLSLR